MALDFLDLSGFGFALPFESCSVDMSIFQLSIIFADSKFSRKRNLIINLSCIIIDKIYKY